MIKTAAQLKVKVRNLSGGDNQKAQMLIRNFSGAIHNQLLLRIE
jgi:ABC-type iron transport system FetAB ATPase subunit